METLLIALTIAAALIAVSVTLVLSGWLPRLAARAGYVWEWLLLAQSRPTKLSTRERAELIARLWMPW